MDRGRVRASGPGRAEFFQFIPVFFHIKLVLSGAQKSSTGSNLRYTQCLDFEYPVHTGTPDPRFTGFTGYGKSRIRIPVPDLEFRWRKKKSTCQVTQFSSILLWSFYTASFIGLPACIRCKTFFACQCALTGQSVAFFPATTATNGGVSCFCGK